MPNVLKTSQGEKGKYRAVPAFEIYPNVRHRHLHLNWITRTRILAKMLTVIKKYNSVYIYIFVQFYAYYRLQGVISKR